MQQIQWPPEDFLDKLAQWQLAFFVAGFAHRKRLLNCGRGAGKDYISLYDMVYRAILSYHRKREEGFERLEPIVMCAVVAPVKRYYIPAWRKLLKIVPKIPGIDPESGDPNYKVWHKSNEERIQLFGPNGILIQMVSGFNDVVGDGWDYTVITEGCRLDEDTFFDSIEPMFIRDGYEGYITINSTPWGLDDRTGEYNWFDRACAGAGAEEDGTYNPDKIKEGYFSDFHYTHATSYDKFGISDEFRLQLDRLKEQDTEKWLRERMGRLFTQRKEQSGFCPISKSVIEGCYYSERIAWGRHDKRIIGFDISYLGPDPAALVVYNDTHKAIEDVRVWLRLTPDEVCGIIEATIKEFADCEFTLVYDATAAKKTVLDYVEGLGDARVRGMKFTESTITAYGTDLSIRMSKKLLRLPDERAVMLFTSPKQQAAVIHLYRELTTWRQGMNRIRGVDRPYFFRGKGCTDDIIQALLCIMSVLPKPKLAVSSRITARYLRGSPV